MTFRNGARCFLLLAFLSGCAGAGRSVDLVPVTEPLPTIFAPLSWKMSEETSQELFAGRPVQDDIPGWDGREKLSVTMIRGLKWESFGDSFVSVARDADGRVRWIGIETSENRDACQTPARSVRLSCRNGYGPELQKVLSDVKRRLSAEYGPAASRKRRSGDPREESFRWVRRGFNVSLSINRSDDGDWTVNLFAARRVQPGRRRAIR